MSKIIVSCNSHKHLEDILTTKVDGIIIYLDKLSVNSSFYLTIDEILKLNTSHKEVFLCLNKIMHNKDLELLEEVLTKVKNTNYNILFYDLAVYNIAKRLGIENRLIIYQDHLNANSYSHTFYNDLGIKGSYLNSDITKEEILNIKHNTKGIIMFTIYGYLPIFYSRRYLITNYLKYINYKKNGTNYLIKGDNGNMYPIVEELEGTTVYSHEPVSLFNKINELKDLDYLVVHSVLSDNDKVFSIINKYYNNELIEDGYQGFYNTKTIFKVKGE